MDKDKNQKSKFNKAMRAICGALIGVLDNGRSDLSKTKKRSRGRSYERTLGAGSAKRSKSSSADRRDDALEAQIKTLTKELAAARKSQKKGHSPFPSDSENDSDDSDESDSGRSSYGTSSNGGGSCSDEDLSDDDPAAAKSRGKNMAPGKHAPALPVVSTILEKAAAESEKVEASVQKFKLTPGAGREVTTYTQHSKFCSVVDTTLRGMAKALEAAIKDPPTLRATSSSVCTGLTQLADAEKKNAADTARRESVLVQRADRLGLHGEAFIGAAKADFVNTHASNPKMFQKVMKTAADNILKDEEIRATARRRGGGGGGGGGGGRRYRYRGGSGGTTTAGGGRRPSRKA
jgi:uncharacterized membrane protein YgcG